MTTGLAKGKGTTPWVQPVLVLKTGSHEETVRLAAIASAGVYQRPGHRPQDTEAFREWLSGPFTKSVRRAALKDILKVKAWAEEEGIKWEAAEAGESLALALPPMEYEALPKLIARLQVAGTDFPKDPTAVAEGHGTLRGAPTTTTVAVLSSLTTGKAAAQAAHALWKWMLAADAATVEAWVQEGLPTRLTLVTAEELSALAALAPSLAVYDNGLTEVAPKTLTAVAVK